MIKAVVLGSPIAHSLSPKIHKRAFEILGIAGEYQAIEVDESNFMDFFDKFSKEDWSGFSLTMPLKEIALGALAEVDERARRINSANTLYKNLVGWALTSTDLIAFENFLPVDLNSKVAIIGGGGTARAAIGALDSFVSKISSVDVLLRSPERLKAMSQAAPNLRVNQIAMDSSLESYDLVIQTTPAQAFDPYADNLTSTSGTLVECLYKPWPTKLVARFIESGGTVISGKQLLVEQALFQIELFTNQKFDFAQMRQELLSHIALD